MEMWFSDVSTPNIKLSIRVKKQLFSERSDIQQVDVFDSEDLGRFITLDGEIVFFREGRIYLRRNGRPCAHGGAPQR